MLPHSVATEPLQPVARRKADLVVRVVIQQLTPNGILVSSSGYYLAEDAFGREVVAGRVLAILE